MSDPQPSGKRRRRSVTRFVVIHVIEALALLLAGGLVVMAVMAWRLSQGPISLDPWRADFETALARAFNGDIVALGGAQVEWEADDRSLVIALTDVAVAEVGGGLVAEAPRLEAGLRMSALLQGDVEITRLVAQGGEFSIVRGLDGAISAGLGRPQHARRLQAEPSGGSARENIERVVAAAAQLSALQLEQAVLHVQDARSGIDWRGENASITLSRGEEGFRLSARGGLAAAGGPSAPLSIEIETTADLSQASARISLTDAWLSDLAPAQGALAALAALEAPLSFSASAAYDERYGVTAGEVRLASGEGTIDLGGERVEPVRDARLHARYDPDLGAMELVEAVIDVGGSQIAASGRVEALDQMLADGAGGAFPFDFEIRDVTLDATPMFSRPIEIRRLRVAGEAEPGALAARLDALEVDLLDLSARLTGSVRFETASDGRVLPAIALRGPIDGAIRYDDVLALWPVELADGARDYLVRALEGGDISDAVLDLDLPVEALVERRLPNDRLRLDFAYENADVRIVSTMSPITDAEGTATLFGNAFELDMTRGRMRGLALRDGRISIPRLNPKGALATFSAIATGPARDLVAYIDEPPLEYPSSFGISPDDIGGTGEVEIVLNRPMLVEVDPADITFSLTGAFSDVSAPAVAGLRVAEADVEIEASEAGLRLWGPGYVGPVRADIEWSEDFLEPDRSRSSSITVNAVINAATLDELGVPARSFLGGEALVGVRARGRGTTVSDAQIEADLTDAELRIPGLTWMKPIGEPGEASFGVTRSADGIIGIDDLRVEADGLSVFGGASFTEAGRLEALTLDRLQVGTAFDLSADVTRSNDDGVIVTLDAGYLDARGVLSQLIRMSGGGEDDPPSEDPAPAATVFFSGTVDRALVTDTVTLDDIRVTLEHDGEALQGLDFEAMSASGPITAVVAAGDGGARRVRASAADAGGVFTAMFGLDQIEGGALSVDGVLPPPRPDGEDLPSDFRVRVEDFQLVRVPALAQILTIGSLRGLADTLGGEGIAFTELDAGLRVEDGRFELYDARAAGPSLGVTVSGPVSFTERTIALEGAIVPAYTYNSLLGVVPVIGDLLVSREGEGVFALRYSLNGSFDEFNVFVNPLSALTPGFMRRIFEGAPDAAQMTTPEGESGR